MKKLLLAVLLFVSTLSFAGTINYHNQTDQTIQMLRDGVPPGIGSNVIPNGFYSETVGYGTYLLQATNGQQTTAGYSCTISADNSRCDYTVSIQRSYNRTPGLTYVSLLNYGRFNVNAPVQLKGDAPTKGTTNYGKPYTSTIWSAELTNGDTYVVGISDYGFATSQEDLANATNAYANSLKGTVTKQEYLTVSGQSALMSTIDSTNDGHNLRSFLLVVIKGNSAYIFAFITDKATPGTDMNAVTEFFRSAAIN